MVKIKLLLVGLFLYSSLWAQEEAPYHIFFSTSFQLGAPQEALKRNFDRVGIGGGGLVLFQIKRLPVFAGVEITFMNLDSESETYSDNTEWTTRSNLFLGNGVIRFQPFVDFPVYPYFDALFGMKNFYTRTAIKYLDTDETDSSSDGSDWALSYGLAIGAQLAVFRNPAITLDIRCSYSQGNNATYFARNPNATGPFNDPIEAFQQRTTPTPLLIPQIGVTLNLNHPFFSDMVE
ncbi:MAG: hypothetical protein R2828_26395 [Saprospiraceae bacterium]